MTEIPEKIDIDEQCTLISEYIKAYDEKFEHVALLKGNEALKRLRRHYRKNSQLFRVYTERLKTLSAELRKRLVDSEDDLVESYLRVLFKQKALKVAGDIYKEALEEVFRARNYKKVKLSDGALTVQLTEKMILPQKETEKRQLLMDLLKENGGWEQVMAISLVLLKKALSNKMFSESDENMIRRLCQFEEAYLVTPKSLSTQIKKDKAWTLIENSDFIHIDEDDSKETVEFDELSNDYDNPMVFYQQGENSEEDDEEEKSEDELEYEMEIHSDICEEKNEFAEGLARSHRDGWYYDDVSDDF